MLTVLNVIGTRPEAIKMAPVIHVLLDSFDSIRPLVCSTGQHAELLDDVLQVFDIQPDFNLAVMEHDQSLTSVRNPYGDGKAARRIAQAIFTHDSYGG